MAMLMTEYRKQIPKYWYHDRNLTNSSGDTVLMLSCKSMVNINIRWYHNGNKQNKKGYTPAMLCV